MKIPLLLLLILLCITAIPVISSADNYLGGTVELGGSGVKVTHTTATATTAARTPTVPPTILATTGSLSITTTPAGAAVFVDNVQKGISPVTITGLAAGSHSILIIKDGYNDLSATVTVTAGQTQAYTTTLVASPAGTPAPAPTPKKTPGFAALAGIAGIGALLLVRGGRR